MVLKNYVLDTSVLLHDGNALFNFDDNQIYITDVVQDELDLHKTDRGETGHNARQVIRTIDALIQEGKGDRDKGLELPNGGKLFFLRKTKPLTAVAQITTEEPLKIDPLEKVYSALERVTALLEDQNRTADSKIIDIAMHLMERDKEVPTFVVSKDINFRIEAYSRGLPAQDYEYDRANIDLGKFYGRTQEFEVGGDLITAIHKNQIEIPDELKASVQLNQYLTLKNGPSQSVLAKIKGNYIQKLKSLDKGGIESIKPKNREQRFLLDACLDPELGVVCGIGRAGTGKTLLAILAGVSQVMGGTEHGEKFEKVVVYRSTPQTRLGYLPGGLDEKLDPYFKPIWTTIKVIFGKKGNDYPQIEELIECLPLDLAKGETHHNSYVVVDDAQDLTPEEVKLIGTRIGEGTKLVFTGDPYQISNPYLDEKSCGLTHLVESLGGKFPEVSYVFLYDVVRSKIAGLFAEHYH
jgi:PhoH-like ATPase